MDGGEGDWGLPVLVRVVRGGEVTEGWGIAIEIMMVGWIFEKEAAANAVNAACRESPQLLQGQLLQQTKAFLVTDFVCMNRCRRCRRNHIYQKALDMQWLNVSIIY